MLSRVQLFASPWTVAHQALMSMGFCRQEYWSGLTCPPLRGIFQTQGLNPLIPVSPALQADSFPAELWRKTFTTIKNKTKLFFKEKKEIG